MDIRETVRVLGESVDIRRQRLEGDKAPIAADRRAKAVTVPLLKERIHGNQLSVAGDDVMDENIRETVGVGARADQIRRLACESDVLSVVRDRRGGREVHIAGPQRRVAVGRGGIEGLRDIGPSAFGDVHGVNIDQSVVVLVVEIFLGKEDDRCAVRRDRRSEGFTRARRVAVLRQMEPVAGHKVEDDHVAARAVAIAAELHQIRRRRLERYEPAVAGHRGIEAVAVRKLPIEVERNQPRFLRKRVANVDVGLPARIHRRKVARIRLEGDKAAAVADGSVQGAVGRVAGQRRAVSAVDPAGDFKGIDAVVEVDVRKDVGVRAKKVARLRMERDQIAVARDVHAGRIGVGAGNPSQRIADQCDAQRPGHDKGRSVIDPVDVDGGGRLRRLSVERNLVNERDRRRIPVRQVIECESRIEGERAIRV